MVFEALAHGTILNLLVGGGWADCSDVALEVRDDALREELIGSMRINLTGSRW